MHLDFVKYLSCALTGLGLVTLIGPTLPALYLLERLRFLHQPNLTTWILRLGWILAIVSTGCLEILHSKIHTSVWIFLFLVAGLSHAFLIPSYNRCIQNQACDSEKDDDESKGLLKRKPPPILLYSILRTWGMCLAIPVSGTIVLNQLPWDPERRFLDLNTVELAALMPGGDHDGYVEGFRVLWPVWTGVAALGGISSLFVK
ncbi:uncharacterized protein ATNIH1004_003080 [Aspergillus tanneri]|nr:uncharacterized protein ATNIH1004_003080 [Aspergillus tanneri]KAA8650396.1 hypothetical protein ATNIH1004_003080 [Aspergillus tanneri]